MTPGLARHKRKLTVIVIPQTAKRSYSFTFSPLWLVAMFFLVAGLGTGVWFFQTEAESLRANLSELDSLRTTNRLQQAQIEEMQATAIEIQDRLQELETLEQQIKQMTGQETGTISRSAESRREVSLFSGRGGPQPGGQRAAVLPANLPTLSMLLPSDVQDYVLRRRNTLQLDLKLSNASASPAQTLESARSVNSAFHEQLQFLEDSAKALVDGKQELADHLDYLAHLPGGMPVTGARITDRFGWRWSPFGWGQQPHDGIDFAHDTGTPIHATADGVVVHAGWKSGGYGYAVMIDHGYGFITLYAHMSDWNVEYGQEVQRGEVIGWVGSTGLSTGPHLHYEVWVDGNPVDPIPYLQ